MTSFRFPFHADTRLKYKHYYQIVELKGLFGKHLAKTLAHLVSQLLPHRYLDTCSVNMWQQSRTAQFSPISGHVLPKQNSKEKISEWYDDMMKYWCLHLQLLLWFNDVMAFFFCISLLKISSLYWRPVYTDALFIRYLTLHWLGLLVGNAYFWAGLIKD